MTIEVRRVDAATVRPLRNRVLRPHRLDDVPAYDTDPGAVHVAAFIEAEVVGTATVFPSPLDGVPSAWQLRGMAVAPERQGVGVGRAVLVDALAVVKNAGATLLWANARITALAFYQRLGWDVVSEEFVHGDSGVPHRVISLGVEDRA